MMINLKLFFALIQEDGKIDIHAYEVTENASQYKLMQNGRERTIQKSSLDKLKGNEVWSFSPQKAFRIAKDEVWRRMEEYRNMLLLMEKNMEKNAENFQQYISSHGEVAMDVSETLQSLSKSIEKDIEKEDPMGQFLKGQYSYIDRNGNEVHGYLDAQNRWIGDGNPNDIIGIQTLLF